jgi:hypothetical protein
MSAEVELRASRDAAIVVDARADGRRVAADSRFGRQR